MKMKFLYLFSGFILMTAGSFAQEPHWPDAGRAEVRPWTWWWWHGSAVNKADITSGLESLHQSGIGGVTIVTLLDVQDAQAKKLGYLSPEWVDAVVFAIREARRLGMNADLAPVPGWAFGGPWVPRNESCARVEIKYWNKGDSSKLLPGDLRDLDTLILSEGGGQSARDTYFALLTRRETSFVRMPVPDGKGPVVDHLQSSAVKKYLGRFDEAFKDLTPSDMPRAFMNDSWEINLDWTPGLPDEFQKRRGYDLRRQIPAFMGQGSPELVSRVACDYRNTISDLMISEFTETFHAWAAGHGSLITGETINEPGNELDLNALYDIPQADMGGPRDWFIRDGDYATDHFFRRCKIPGSAAHILGKPLISSETLTCMGPILNTPLELVKEKIDYDFVAGVNHTMFHGITYSPAEARWPGWLFYAGTHLGPFNPMWRQGSQLCDYITRCQSFLQSGKPDADVLVYYPIFDLWSQRKAGKPSPPGVISMEEGSPQSISRLWRAGHDFDYASDKLLESMHVAGGRIVAPGASYGALIISDCRLMPDETLKQIVQWANEGATIIFHGKLPDDVPGFGRLEERRARFRETIRLIGEVQRRAGKSGAGLIGKGRMIFGSDILDCLEQSNIPREAMTDSGLRYFRRLDNQGTTYFISNPADNKSINDWIPIASRGISAVIFDPMTGAFGSTEIRRQGSAGCSVHLMMEPRESIILRILNTRASGPSWLWAVPSGAPVSLKGKWEVRFIEGGEIIPHPENIDSLFSWTEWKSDQQATLQAFSGAASYTLRFPTPAVKADAWAIDLGEVCHTARVRLNGRVLGDLISGPMRVITESLAKEGLNVLEIEVANAAINRAANLDIHGISWMKTVGEDAQSITIGDFLFPWTRKGAGWVPYPSGLLGPVQLIPMARVR